MPAISWSDADTYIKPTPAWRFFCTLPTIPGTPLDGQTLSFYIERMSAPNVGINFEPAPYNSGERQFPNQRTIDVIEMTLMEDTNYSVIQYLRAWKDSVIDDLGNYGLPKDWKQSISLEPLDEQGNSNITFSYSGCAPGHVPPYDFDGSATQHVRCTVTFVTDIMDPFAQSPTNTSGTSPSPGTTSPSNSAGDFTPSFVG